MNESQILKQTFIEFFEKLLPSILDPMCIVSNRWNVFKKILQDEKKTVQDIADYVNKINKKDNSDQKDNDKQHRKQSVQNDAQSNLLFEPQTYFKLNMPTKNLFVKQPSQNIIRQNSRKTSTKRDELKIPSIQKISLDNYEQEQKEAPILKVDLGQFKKSPEVMSQFKRMFQFQNKGFPIVAREYIADALSLCLIEFQKHTDMLQTVENRSFEINTGELTETDKKLHGQNYTFESYSKVARQKSFQNCSVFEQKKLDFNI